MNDPDHPLYDRNSPTEYGSPSFGRTHEGRARPLTSKERLRAERSVRIHRETTQQAINRLRG